MSMSNFDSVTPEDLKIAASIERRRQLENARKQRIFNSRFRKIGIDKEFLDKQVEDKKHRQELERTEERQLDEALIRGSKLALFLEEQREEERWKIEKEIENFRRVHQRPEDRRDCDLYDPRALKKELENAKERCLRFAEQFGAEDSDLRERMKVRKEETRWWIEKQKKERLSAEKDSRDADRAYEEAVISRDKRALALNRMEEDCRRKLNEATARFNRALAQEQEHRRRCEAVQDEEDKRAEIYNHVTGDFLREAREQAESNRGANKPLASRYKGMTAAELKIFRDGQARQIEEIAKTKFEEKCANEQWDRLMKANALLARTYQRELDRKKTDINKTIADQNLQLARQQKSRQEYLDRVIYENKPTAAFYEQFNKGSR